MAKPKVNPIEELAYEFAPDYVNLVLTLLQEEVAPARPWWSKQLTADQKLWRYLEIRDQIVPWMVEAGIFMGWVTFKDLLDNMEQLWMSHVAIDVIPPEIFDQVPMPLLELVQANPRDAAKHIREMERILANRARKQVRSALVPPALPSVVG